MNDQDKQRAEIRQQVTQEQISRRAEELWRQYGCPEGRDEAIWLEAEQQLLGIQQISTSQPPASENVGRNAQQDSGNQSGSDTPGGSTRSAPAKPREMELMKGGASNNVLGGSGSLGGIGGGPAPARSRSRSNKSAGK